MVLRTSREIVSVPVFNHFVGMAECILMTIESETRRLFPSSFL